MPFICVSVLYTVKSSSMALLCHVAVDMWLHDLLVIDWSLDTQLNCGHTTRQTEMPLGIGIGFDLCQCRIG